MIIEDEEGAALFSSFQDLDSLAFSEFSGNMFPFDRFNPEDIIHSTNSGFMSF